MTKIEKIEFGLLSPSMIKAMASVKIDKAELYDPDGFPVEGGLFDTRLGVIDPGLRCRVCGGRIGKCLGHFGYLELVKPVINPLFANYIAQLLNVTCSKCGRLLVSEEEIKKMKDPLNEAPKKAPAVCPHCKAKQKKIKFEKPTSFFEGNKKLTPEDVRERLEKIPDEDLKLLGFNGGRPEWMVFTLLPIPPVTVRPSITLETGGRSEDDLTHKLVDIVKINDRLKKNIELGAPDFIIDDIWELLQYHVSTYIDNELPNIPPACHRSGRPLKTLVQRLQKKEGRFRGNLTGKRVNFSARTVISPDTKISLNEVGVPLEIAKELTIPEKVTKSNKERLKKLVLNGENYPGANYIIRPDGLKKKITEENKKDIAKEIDIGYTVERHLMDGDIVILNRQPSLHRMSMMAHKARIIPWRTFTINLTATIPYNADFDGDEMNLHVPQTEEARVEARKLMLVEKNIRSPRYGLPVIACKHDHISGLYLLTREKSIDKRTAIRLLMSALGPEKLADIVDEIPDKISGKDLFSLLLPKDLNITFKSATEEEVVIKDGKLVSGSIDENAVGERKGKLLNRIEKQFGPEIAAKFLDEASKLALEYITMRGFSTSTSDADIPSSAKRRIMKIVEEKVQESVRLFKLYEHNEEYENDILRLGNEIVNRSNEIVRKHLKDSDTITMIKSGARGSYVTANQISGLIGQKVLEGKLITRGFINRTTSHFTRGEHNLFSHGFISSSYKDGLKPIEFFFDAASSRENLMDKSLQTKHSGYMERRLMNALQDLKVEYDFTVRDSSGMIIQFVPGEDGVDPAKSDDGEVRIYDE